MEKPAVACSQTGIVIQTTASDEKFAIHPHKTLSKLIRHSLHTQGGREIKMTYHHTSYRHAFKNHIGL